ncbi:NAD(P)H-dependent oxidoreductase [Fundidesulfovibrio soli]|uniref:NAD(P)H-dependent oxidoreductase n=1 Tax=Fundidesulfovibrio soli TaxID=2922716 RepID=UPI001FAFF124|nr:NAD(P)H-dependent oxidoreductase [Fundidesulfovibrio soli]
MRRVLLLAGSPRAGGVSLMLGRELLERMAGQGPAMEAQTLRVSGLLDAQEGRARLHAAFAWADTVVLSAPVYVDSPPAQVLKALEFLAAEPWRGEQPKRFCALFCCGFPEASHTDICLDVSRIFARKAGMEWAGGLGFGGSGALGGETLAARGRMAAPAVRALDLAARALADGRPVPIEARELAARPLIPKPLYLLLAESGFLAQAWKSRSLTRLGAQPFAEQ